MAIQITREEYQKKFGVAPTINEKQDDFDITPAPVLITKSEYDAKFRPPTPTAGDNIKELGRKVVETSPLGIPINMYRAAKAGLTRGKEGFGQLFQSMEDAPAKDKLKLLGFGILNIGASVPQTYFSPITGLVSYGANLPGVKTVIDKADDYIVQPIADKVSESPYIQSIAMNVPQNEAESLLTLATLLFSVKKGPQIRAKVGEALTDITGAKNTVYNPKTKMYEVPAGETGNLGLVSQTQNMITKYQQAKQSGAVTKLTNELAAIENNYSALRKSQKFEVDEGSASRQRIAEAQVTAGILDGAVDVDGTIRTANKGGAADKYAAQTIDGAEGVVRQNLVREGKTVNIEEIRNDMITAIDSAFEGSELKTALNGIEKEIAGLRTRADEFGNIPLEKLQDAKINTTKNINYKKDANAAITFKKTKGRVYKELIEKKSEIAVEIDGKRYGIPDINKELSKYYGDIERLLALDGRKVKGGRLGKYVAQLSGNLIGGAAGALLGPAGAAIGGALGGEAAASLKGFGFTKTFGQGGSGALEKNPILAAAQKTGKLPMEINLKVPDVKVGVPQGITKTKDMLLTEKQIAKNVESQKKAIKAGDFGLVASLKVVYQALVEKLKSLIKQVKDTPNKQGGFVKNPAQSNNLGNRNTQYNKTKTINKTSITKSSTKPSPESSLLQEAKKYKSADEFQMAIKDKFIKEQGFEPSSIKVVDEWYQAKQTQPFIGVGGQNPDFFSKKPTLAELPKSEVSKYLEFTPDGKAIYYRGINKDVKTRNIRWGDFISPDKGKASFYGKVEKYELDPKHVKQLGNLEAVYFNPKDKLNAPKPISLEDIWKIANKK